MRFEVNRHDSFPLAEKPDEIQSRIGRRYIDRLGDKLRRLRKDLQERNWDSLKTESRQLRGSGEAHGFPGLTILATEVEKSIPPGSVSRVRPLPQACKAVEKLIAEIDAILVEKSKQRSLED